MAMGLRRWCDTGQQRGDAKGSTDESKGLQKVEKPWDGGRQRPETALLGEKKLNTTPHRTGWSVHVSKRETTRLEQQYWRRGSQASGKWRDQKRKRSWKKNDHFLWGKEREALPKRGRKLMEMIQREGEWKCHNAGEYQQRLVTRTERHQGQWGGLALLFGFHLDHWQADYKAKPERH